MKLICTVYLVFFMAVLNISAQEKHNHEGHDEEHDHIHHSHHKSEIGIANAPVYFVKEKELTYGLHLHYIHQLGASKFGLGFGYEKIFDDHNHQTIGIVANYRITSGLSVNIAPGVTFEQNNTDELNFALHIESVYEWELGNFHLGPVAEFAYDPEDYHLSLGLHVGYGF